MVLVQAALLAASYAAGTWLTLEVTGASVTTPEVIAHGFVSPLLKSMGESEIIDELRTQYLLAYYPTRRLSDSNFRRIEVKTSGVPAGPALMVRHRTGYYTSKSPF